MFTDNPNGNKHGHLRIARVCVTNSWLIACTNVQRSTELQRNITYTISMHSTRRCHWCVQITVHSSWQLMHALTSLRITLWTLYITRENRIPIRPTLSDKRQPTRHTVQIDSQTINPTFVCLSCYFPVDNMRIHYNTTNPAFVRESTGMNPYILFVDFLYWQDIFFVCRVYDSESFDTRYDSIQTTISCDTNTFDPCRSRSQNSSDVFYL